MVYRVGKNSTLTISCVNPGGPLPGGKVEVAIMPSGVRRVVAGAVWASWAGEPVGDGSGNVGQ
jgi:hypothetical protein